MAVRNLFFVFIVLLLLGSCDNDSPNEVLIRILNKSDVTFNDTKLNNENFGTLAPNQKSEYRVFAGAYEIGTVSIIIEGENYLMLPSDFIGETLLSNGKYTFQYIFDFQSKNLRVNLVED